MAEGVATQAPELAALDRNRSVIKSQVKSSNLDWFSDKLVEKAFIAHSTAEEILTTRGDSVANKVGRLMDHVYGALDVAGNKREKFDSFVDIFSHDAPYSDLAQKLNNAVLPTDTPTQSVQQSSNEPSNEMQSQSQVNEIPVPLCTIDYVGIMIKELKKKFRGLKKNVLCYIEEQQITVAEVREVLTQLSPDADEYHKMFLESHVKNLVKAENHSELFLIMNSHWNYLDPSLLCHIVDELELDGVKPGTESYQLDLQQFRQRVPLKPFMESQQNKKKKKKIQAGFTKLVAEFDWPQTVMLEDAEQFRQEYATHYSLHECAMMLIQVRPGSFIIVWLIPVAIVEKLKGNVPTEVLIKHRVQTLTVDRTCVYSDETKPVGENRNSSMPDDFYFIGDKDESSDEEVLKEKEAPKSMASSHRADSKITPFLPSTNSDTANSPDVVKSKLSPSTAAPSSSSQIPVQTIPSPYLQKPFDTGSIRSGLSADSGFASEHASMASSTISLNLPSSNALARKHGTGSLIAIISGSSQEHRTKGKPLATKHGNQLSIECHEKRRTPFGLIRGSATTDGQFAYFASDNSSSLYSYEYTSEKWEKLPRCPYYNSGLAIINEDLTTIGGDGSNKLMTLQQGKWGEEYPPMMAGRNSPAVLTTSDGNYLFVIGGQVGGNWSDTVELLQLKTIKWYTATNLPENLLYPSAAIYGDQLNLLGWGTKGFSCSIQNLPSSDEPIMSPLTLSWTSLPQLPVIWSTPATLSEHLVIIGGWQEGSIVNSIHQLVDGCWMNIGTMVRGRRRCSVLNQSPDKILIVGGYGAHNIAVHSTEDCIAYDV